MNLNHVCGTVHKLRFSHSGGATESGEPGIYTPRPVVMDSGLAAFAAPRNDAAYDSKFRIA
jgi:hypothetical protein